MRIWGGDRDAFTAHSLTLSLSLSLTHTSPLPAATHTHFTFASGNYLPDKVLFTELVLLHKVLFTTELKVLFTTELRALLQS